MQTVLLYVAYGWLLFAGAGHFAIHVVFEYWRGSRGPNCRKRLCAGARQVANSSVLAAMHQRAFPALLIVAVAALRLRFDVGAGQATINTSGSMIVLSRPVALAS
jgi:hypothetical protein